jgi:hypothetical protein
MIARQHGMPSESTKRSDAESGMRRMHTADCGTQSDFANWPIT